MEIKFNGKFGIRASGQIAHDKGLLPGGRIQSFIDNEVIKQMEPFTPRRDGGGFLAEQAPRIGTVIGSGHIIVSGPYARFQYYGNVMVDPDTGSTWAKKFGHKVVTDRPLQYNGGPQRGSHWFDRMKAARGQDILDGAQKLLDRGGQ